MEESPIARWHTVEYLGPKSRLKVLRQAGEEAYDNGIIPRVPRHD